MQPNIPILEGAMWTRNLFSGHAAGLDRGEFASARRNEEILDGIDLIVWPESPAPFYTNDPFFRDAVSALARQSGDLGGVGLDWNHAGNAQRRRQLRRYSIPLRWLIRRGEWVGRYDKVHLVPFGEYLPFPQVFAFAGGLTKEVGEFQRGASRAPLDAGGQRLGMFICYESIFPDEVRQGPLQGAQVLVNISNDGWYGDSGAWKQHLQQTQMRAIENERWLLAATNTGMTASVDPYGRIVAATPRKVRTALAAPYALSSGTTFYTRHGDWFAYLCAIISAGVVVMRFVGHGGNDKDLVVSR